MDTVIAFVVFGGGSVLAFRWLFRRSDQLKRVRDEGAKQIVCPHCNVKGSVNVKSTRVARGISGGKAAFGWITGGSSIFFTGLSRNQLVTQAKCGNCRTEWVIE